MVALMIIPVLDIKEGVAVSGKSGNRNEYKPLKTVFDSSSDPLKISEALKNAGASEIYIADLDAIEGRDSNLDLVGNINQILPVMLDSGACDLESVAEALQVSDKVIVATETLRSLGDLDEIFCKVKPERLIISIDVLNNEILTKHLELDFNILRKIVEKLKPSQIIILDISNVGCEGGINWQLMDDFAGIESSIIFGGGVTAEDFLKLDGKIVDKVLVGTALHHGRIKPIF